MFGDNSIRTKKISKNAISVMIATIMLFICIPWYLIGSHTYKQILARSSSPIGTTMTFNRSQAEVKISDIYTDKKKDVLIVRLAVDSAAQARLPYKGDDYKVYISSKSTNGLTSMPILFGRMSTDGDMFLIIPKPTDTVYSIFIQNKNYIGDGQSTSRTNVSDVADLSEDSVAAALSNYNYEENSKTKNQGTYQIASDDNDTISFRLTINPASKDTSFKPKVINADLLTSDKSGNISFDFEKFFNKVFKESALKSLKAQYQTLSDKKARYEKTLRDYQERYAENENDTVAKSQIEIEQNKLADLDNELETLADKISSYQKLKFNDSLFKNILTQAKIFNFKK